MNGGRKRKIQGSACAVIATACLVALTGVSPGPVAALWTGSHGSSGSTTAVFVERGVGGYNAQRHLHSGVRGHLGLTHQAPAGRQSRG